MTTVVVRWLVPAAFLLAGISPAQETASSQPGNSGLTFQTGAQEVGLDMVVRDAKGKIVKNVTAADVQVLENGQPQKLVDFRFVQGRDSNERVSTTQDANGTAASVAVQAGPTRQPINEVNVICMVFHSLDPGTKRNAVAFARQFVQNDLPPSTYLGVFSLGDSLIPLHEFTDDKAEMLRAISASPSGGPQDFMSMSSRVLSASPNITTIVAPPGNGPGTSANSAYLVVTGGEVTLQAITGADVSNGQGADRVRGDQADARREFTGVAAHRNFDSMTVLITQLAKLPGHKSVLFLSTGLTGLDDPDRMEKMVKRANDAGITIYAIDVSGLQQNSNSLAGNNSLNYAASVSQMQTTPAATSLNSGQGTTNAAQNMEKMRQGDYINQGVRQSNTQATLRQISEDTGGFLIANTNDLRKPFARIIGDLQTHYEAVYRPESGKLDGTARTIEVKLNHPGWTVDSRTGYYALPASSSQNPLTSADLLGLAAMNAKPAPHAFQFDSVALQYAPSANATQRAIAFELPVRNLAVAPLNGGENYRVHASVLILIKDPSGNVIDRYSQDSPFVFPKSALKQAAVSTLDFTHPINLPEGKYTAEVAVVDQESRRASVSEVAFENGTPKPLEVSSVTLVQRVQALTAGDPADPFVVTNGSDHRRVVPEIRTALGKDAKPVAYFVVYPDTKSAQKPKLQLEYLVNGKPLARQMAELGPPMANGAVPMLVQAPVSAGDCELKITAVQGTESFTQSLHYSVNP